MSILPTGTFDSFFFFFFQAEDGIRDLTVTGVQTCALPISDVVALYDSAGFSDARGVALVNRTKKDLTRVFGRPRPIGKSGWEWRYGRKLVRFNWRGRGTARWISVTLIDRDVMDRIGRYATPAARRKS